MLKDLPKNCLLGMPYIRERERNIMRTKTKLFLLSASISVAAAGVLGTTTFAWLTARKNVSATFSNIKISSTAPYLQAAIIPLNHPINEHASDPSIPLPNATNSLSVNWEISDLSSRYGDTFYTFENGKYKEVTSDLDSKRVTFGLMITGAPSSVQQNAKLGLNWNFDSVEDYNQSEKLTNWVRASAVEYTDSTFQSEKTDEGAYKKTWVGGTYLSYCMNYIGMDTSTNTLKPLVMPEQTCSSLGDKDIVFTYTTEETHYYKISFWLEGTVAENQNEARDTEFQFVVNLAS